MIRKYKYSLIIITTIILVALLHVVVSAKDIIDPLCGPKSLLSICEKLSVPATLDELCDLSFYNDQSGTSLFGLYQAATQKGLPAVPVKFELDQLCKIKGYSISFVDGNHFLVVLGCKGDQVLVQDPPDAPYYLKKDKFKEKWHGETLVFSEKFKKQMEPQLKKQSSQINGPQIQFFEMDYNFGTVSEGDLLTHHFKFINLGTDPLKVYSRSSCSCTASQQSNDEILPGESGEIIIEFNTKNKKGPTKESIFVRTNDQNNQSLTLTVTAIVQSSIKVIPEILWLDEVSIGEKIVREILVIDSGDRTLQIKNIEVPEGINAKILPAHDDTTVTLSIPIVLSINMGNEIGDYKKQIIVKTNNNINKELIVPISGKVIADVKAFPPTIFFGMVNPNTSAVQEITLSSSNGKRLEIAKAVSSLQYISTEIIPINNSLKFKLVTTIQVPENESIVRDNIDVYVKNKKDPIIKIPLYARIEK